MQRSSRTAAVAMTRCSESKRPRNKQPCDKYAFPWEEEIKPEDRRNTVYLLTLWVASEAILINFMVVIYERERPGIRCRINS